MADNIAPNDNIIDMRNVIGRFEELRDERAALEEVVTDADDEFASAHEADQPALLKALHEARAALKEWDDENGEELASLERLIDETRGNGGDYQWEGDWFPGTLINDDYFEDYAEELVKDVEGLPRNIPDYIVIDWAATASNIQQDYTSCEWEGETFWYR